jgi:hypothetical protein
MPAPLPPNLRERLFCPMVQGEMSRVRAWIGLAPVVLVLAACKLGGEPKGGRSAGASPPAPHHVPPPPPPPDAPPEVLAQPVPLWKSGKVAAQIDAAAAGAKGHLLLDLGEAWVPYIFTDGVDPAGVPLPNAYRPTYLALARGETPDDLHGERAARDKYLELYGIMPTLHLMRDRFRRTMELPCVKELELQPLIDFTDVVVHESNQAAYKVVDDYRFLNGAVRQMLQQQHVDDPDALDVAALDKRDQDKLKRYRKTAPEFLAVAAAQDRLKCEGYMQDRRYVRGALDWSTRDALAELERRHRVYSWGYLGKDTLAVLRVPPAEAERQSVVRVLLERAIHAAGVIEDGSTVTAEGKPRIWTDQNGRDQIVPNLVADLERRLIEAFGLQTPESTLAFLDGLGELPHDKHLLVAIEAPAWPEYYDGDMDFSLEYDRGDVWYDFPYDATGKERAQPVERRPRVTLYTTYLGQKIALARFGTTIGGWRSEQIGETLMWRYKESPPGPRVWDEIVSAPVWLPPDTTPPKDMLKKKQKRKADEPEYEVNYHETGPSYASAYGLVAAYHKKYLERADGTIMLGNDEGIRTHGSVDYMSIMRRHSHGCHRLHNHIAVRLMSFVLTHRAHKRMGNERLAYKKEILYQDVPYLMDIKQGGYVFMLEQPIEVEVLEGRVRGDVKRPIEFLVPKWNPDAGAYVTADGGAVEVQGDQLVQVPLPPPPDGGVPLPPGLIVAPPPPAPTGWISPFAPGAGPVHANTAPAGGASTGRVVAVPAAVAPRVAPPAPKPPPPSPVMPAPR